MSQNNLTTTFIYLRKALERVVRGIAPPKEVEDIVQETYVRACQAERVNEIRAPRSFLYKTARNLAIDYAKRAETRLTIDGDVSDETWLDRYDLNDQTFQEACSDEEFSLFCDAVRLLPKECRRTFVLKKVYGYSQREIAAELGLSQSTIEKHVAQGVKRCAHYMERKKRSGSTQTFINDSSEISRSKNDEMMSSGGGQ